MLMTEAFVSEAFLKVSIASISGEGVSLISRIKNRKSEPSVRAFLSCSKAKREFARGSEVF